MRGVEINQHFPRHGMMGGMMKGRQAFASCFTLLDLGLATNGFVAGLILGYS